MPFSLRRDTLFVGFQAIVHNGLDASRAVSLRVFGPMEAQRNMYPVRSRHPQMLQKRTLRSQQLDSKIATKYLTAAGTRMQHFEGPQEQGPYPRTRSHSGLRCSQHVRAFFWTG
jgi:hypothetical protein